jgi:hypothetical protein
MQQHNYIWYITKHLSHHLVGAENRGQQDFKLAYPDLPRPEIVGALALVNHFQATTLSKFKLKFVENYMTIRVEIRTSKTKFSGNIIQPILEKK